MIKIKAIYYRYRNQMWFSLCLILCGIGLLIWWQMAQGTTTTESSNVATITANQKDDSQHNTANGHQSIKKGTQQIVVDVKGGVHRPGVYYFTQEPIVADVLSKAGGMLPTVNSVRINLAACLTNGQVLYIPIGDEQQPVEYPLPGNMQSQGQVSTATNIDGDEGKLNLNTADITDLQNLPGIGEKRAQDIINEREKLGGFKRVTDLQEVSGIGEKTFAKLEPLVTV
ncbi:ComEA family DNA-binding protein [Weissella hellenica]|uniref:ComEA family DNA-binding protein n=1 Tax=Weissella hellenica TaxID=46256 RepID=A0A4Y4G892_WEIHE|nr:ComEA family DNA-binding protein [Weissella hellenica]NKY67732.1 ComEA family DNA-binding protein [Weissella hellenica]GED36724.1 competence protein ComEA [Weissella hellenica]SCC12717.1 competence protein ComEA [Weissella hellenica]